MCFVADYKQFNVNRYRSERACIGTRIEYPINSRLSYLRLSSSAYLCFILLSLCLFCFYGPCCLIQINDDLNSFTWRCFFFLLDDNDGR